MPSSSDFRRSVTAGIGARAGRELDQRNEERRIEPMGVEKALRMLHGGGQVVDQNGRGGRRDDRPRASDR